MKYYSVSMGYIMILFSIIRIVNLDMQYVADSYIDSYKKKRESMMSDMQENVQDPLNNISELAHNQNTKLKNIESEMERLQTD